MTYQLWQLVGGAVTFVGARPDTDSVEKLRRSLPAGTVVGVARDGVVIRTNASEHQLKTALRPAVASAWREAGGAEPAPLPKPIDAPLSRSTGMVSGRGKAPASDDDEADDGEGPDEEAREAPAPARRPVATRPPLARRPVTSVAGGTLTATPVAQVACGVEPTRQRRPSRIEAPASAPADGSTELQIARTRAEEADAKVGRLQRLLDGANAEREAYRARGEQLEADLALARSRVVELDAEVVREGDRATRAEAEIEHLLRRPTLSPEVEMRGNRLLAEARAETDRAVRHAAELSRQLGALRDAAASAAPVPASAAPVPAQVLRDEVLLARVAEQAARKAVRATREDATLRALASSAGGVEALARLVELVETAGGVDEVRRRIAGVEQLLRSVG